MNRQRNNRKVLCNILWFSQIFENQCHLSGGEEPLFRVVAGLSQRFRERAVQAYPGGEPVQCGLGGDLRCIGLCQFALAVGTDLHAVISLLYMFSVFLVQ